MKKLPKYKINRNIFSCFSCKITQFEDGEYIKVNELKSKLKDLLFDMSQCKKTEECVELLDNFIDKD